MKQQSVASLNFETNTKEKQQAGEICLGQETQWTSGSLCFGLMSPPLRSLVPLDVSCNTEKMNKWLLRACFPLWSMELEVWWCGRVLCWCNDGDSFKRKGPLNQHGYQSRNGVLHQVTQPLQSPDLNPFNGLGRDGWKSKCKKTNTCSASLGTSSRRLETISGDFLMKLLERRPRACKIVIEAKGGYGGRI